MIFWKKKLIECCQCKKRYSFDDNLFYHLKEYILVCPNCNLMHKVDIQLLGKEYDKLKKIDRLNLTAIDIGSAATNRGSGFNGPSTRINKNNPANASGKITVVQVCAHTDHDMPADTKIATFFAVDATHFSTRDYETIGVVVAGATRTFNVDLDVMAGDYLGIWFDTVGWISCNHSAGAVGFWVNTGDRIPCTNYYFGGAAANWIISLYGTGATLGWPHKWNGITIGKLNGAVISKWNGIA